MKMTAYYKREEERKRCIHEHYRKSQCSKYNLKCFGIFISPSSHKAPCLANVDALVQANQFGS